MAILFLVSIPGPALARVPSRWDVEVVQTTAGLSEHLTRLPDLWFVPPSARCEDGQLRVARGPKITAAGHYSQTIVIANVTRQPCALDGYPAIELLSGKARPLKIVVRRGGTSLIKDFGSFPVVLAPRGEASFAFGGRSSKRCPRAKAVGVTVGEVRASVTLRPRDPVCSPGVSLTAIGPGTDSASLGESRLTVAVDDRTRYQRVTGVGAAMTDTSAWLIYDELTPVLRSQLMDDLFGSSGIHLASVLVPLGASDFTSTGRPYTYDDLPAGETDPALGDFSIAHDEAYILPALRQMLALDPQVKVFAVPWTAPAWMKANEALNDLGLLGQPLAADYGPLAEYFVKFIQAYGSEGIPISAIAPANEPNSPAPYPAMSFPEPSEAQWVAGYLEPALEAAGLHPEIYGYDAGWESDTYAQALISSQAAGDLSGIAWHCYSGLPGVMSVAHDLAPALDQAVTECSPGVSPYSVPTALIGAFRNWAGTVMLWNLALDPAGGPVEPPNVGCGHCTGLVTINEIGQTLTLGPTYYQLGQLGSFVEQGAWRIASPSFVRYVEGRTEQVTPGLDDVAFLNPDGSEVLLAYNTSSASIAFAVKWRGRSFTYVLAPAATVTFVWDRR